jgi:hypothetical protein
MRFVLPLKVPQYGENNASAKDRALPKSGILEQSGLCAEYQEATCRRLFLLWYAQHSERRQSASDRHPPPDQMPPKAKLLRAGKLLPPGRLQPVGKLLPRRIPAHNLLSTLSRNPS